MSKKTISTEHAPAAIGAYSQAVRAGDWVYISGQIPLEPQTMAVVEGGFIDQARQVFENLQAVADAAGGSGQKAGKRIVYRTERGDFASLNEIMSEYMAEPYPARAAVQVAALPKGVSIEIDAVLYTA